MNSYHCPTCDKEIVDKELVAQHEKSTGRKVIEKDFEKQCNESWQYYYNGAIVPVIFQK